MLRHCSKAAFALRRFVESNRYAGPPNPHRAISGIVPCITHIIETASRQPSRQRAATYSKVPAPSPAVFGSGLNRFRQARWPDAARSSPFLISMSEIRLDGVPTRRAMELCATRDRPGSRAMPSRIHPIFGAAHRPSRAERFGQSSQMRAGLRRYQTWRREPVSRPIWLQVMQNGPGKCARSGSATKWPRRNLNLPLAARARVGHIRHNGAVAEWLKAAVC